MVGKRVGICAQDKFFPPNISSFHLLSELIDLTSHPYFLSTFKLLLILYLNL